MPLALKSELRPDNRMTPASKRWDASWTGIGITELAQSLGTTSRALRYYEEIGLVTPQRTARGGRTYGPGLRRDLELIVMLRRAGRSIREIQAVLSGDEANDETTRVKVATVLRERLDELEAQSDALKVLLNRFSKPSGQPV